MHSASFKSQCYKTSTLNRHSDSVCHKAASKRKCEADLGKNVMAKAIEVAHLQSEEEIKGLLKTAYFYSRKRTGKCTFQPSGEIHKRDAVPSCQNRKDS